MSLPLWQQIRDRLSGEITEGRYPVGQRLPSEADLARRFAVNRHTVRRAIAEMQDAGLVHARRGSGVYVTGRQISYRLGRRTRFTQNLAEAGLTGSREILRLETLPCSAEEAAALGLRKGEPVHLLETVASANDVPVTHGRSVFPAARLAGFVEALGASRSVTQALAAAGVADYRRRSTRLTAERAGGAIARHLRVPDGAPLLVAAAINEDESGQIIEWGRTHFAADRVELLVDERSFG